METTERTNAACAPEKPQRRVGTFTLGVTLLATGGLMLAAMFLPGLDWQWALKLSPVILILLGTETLIAAKGGGKIKYDWVGMLLCFILTGAALCMCAMAWYMANCYLPEYGRCYDSSMAGDSSGFYMEFDAFNTRQLRLLELEAGDTIRAEIVSDRGSVDVEIIGDEDRESIFGKEALATGTYSIEVPESGSYELWGTGRQGAPASSGSQGRERVPANGFAAC